MARSADCWDEAQLISYSAGQLSAHDMERVAKHLHQCLWCQAVLDSIQTSSEVEPNGDGSGPLAALASDCSAEAPTVSFLASPADGPDDSSTAGKTETPRLLAEYEIKRVLGHGGYGIVYEAFDTVLKRKVAIKVLKRDFASQLTSRRRFIREARAGAAVNHPNVVTIYGVNEAGDMPFLIMELVGGESLHSRIRREPKLEVMDVLRISAQAAQGLAAAHAQGIIHRDVKPANMLVDSVARVKITDFGLARVKLENFELTSRGMAVGTPAYMSPEQVRGENLDARSDLFALGSVIYAMLTGHSPFHGKTTLDILRRIDSYEPPLLTETHKEVPEFLAKITQRLLKKDPDKRYQSAAEVADVLNRHLAMLNQTPTDRLPAALRAELADSRWFGRKTRITVALSSGALLLAVALAIGRNYYGAGGGTSLPEGRAERTPQPVAAAANAAIPAQNSVGSMREVTVGASGNADYRTLNEALRHVAPGGHVIVQDSREYEEAIRLDDVERYAGVTISAPQHAVLKSSDVGPVITIHAIPNLRLIGLRIIAPQSQFAVEIIGTCPGLTLEEIDIERTANPPEVRGGVAALYLRDSARGDAAQPISLRGLRVHSTIVGVVIGDVRPDGGGPRHIVLEESLVHGLSRAATTHLVVMHGARDIVVRRNIFTRGLQGLSVLASEAAAPLKCEFVHNTWHDVETWIAWKGPVPQLLSLEFSNNLLCDCGQLWPDQDAPEPPPDSAFHNNVLVDSQSTLPAGVSSLATRVAEFPILSYDISDDDFLKPDFPQLQAVYPAVAAPGRYSSDLRE